MIRAHYAILLLSGMLASVQGAEGDLRPRFERVRKVEGAFAAGQRGKLAVPDDVFGQSRDFPNDLRILGEDGIQWPCFLYRPQEAVETEELKPEILNRSFVSGRVPFLQFDLVVPQQDGSKAVHNQMEITTSGHDFIRRAEIYTGEKEPARGRMATGYLISFSRQRSAQNRTIRYPSSDEKRLHVRIYSNARNAGETFSLTSVKLRCRTQVDVDRETVDAAALEVADRERIAGAQTRLLDLGETDRPVEYIRFKTRTPSFARSVSVYGRNTANEPWTWVGGGTIHELEGDMQEEIRIRARHRFLKAHIFHYDDQPLAIDAIRLEAVPRFLVFEALSDGKAGLYYRAWDMKPARYDLKERTVPKTIAALPVYSLSDPGPNAHLETLPWRRYSRWFGILAVAIVSILVIGIIASMIRQQKP